MSFNYFIGLDLIQNSLTEIHLTRLRSSEIPSENPRKPSKTIHLKNFLKQLEIFFLKLWFYDLFKTLRQPSSYRVK